jgi:hypothetical protein
MQEDLIVRVGGTPIDRVATHDRNGVRVLLRLVFPLDHAVLTEVERIDDVWEGRMNIHRVADDQRAAFVAAQDTGGEGPGDAQIAGVLAVDLIELAVAMICVVAGRHYPIVIIFLHFQ